MEWNPMFMKSMLRRRKLPDKLPANTPISRGLWQELLDQQIELLPWVRMLIDRGLEIFPLMN